MPHTRREPDTSALLQPVGSTGASEGLAMVVRGMVPRAELAKLMKLSHSQRIVLAQSIGYPMRN